MEREPIALVANPDLPVLHEFQSLSETTIYADKLAHLFMKGRISINEYLLGIRANAGRLITGDTEDAPLTRNERSLRSRDHDIDITEPVLFQEGVATADYLTRKISLPQYRFLMDRYNIFTRLNLRRLAEEIYEREARYAREALIKKVRTGIGKIFKH